MSILTRTLSALALVLALSSCTDKTMVAEEPEPREAVGVASMVDADNKDRPDFRALEQALATDPTTVIPREALDLVGGPEAFKASIESGTIFKVRDKTWQRDGTGGTVQITMISPDGTRSQKLAIMLEDVKQRWYVLQTLPLDDIPRVKQS